YAPVYKYAFAGEQYRHEASVSTSSPPELGATEILLVDPDDPTHAKPMTFMGQWFFVTLFGGLGGTFTLVALIIMFASRVRSPTHTAYTPTSVAVTDTTDHSNHDPFLGGSASDNKGPFL